MQPRRASKSVHLYDTVAVALDASRHLNNGEPSGLAAWLDALGVRRGMRFLHIGCGVGYNTAIVASAVSFEGAVLAMKADAELADQARQNLRADGNVEVRCTTEIAPGDGCFDAEFVSAGATEILPAWLDHLNNGGRALIPLTTTKSVPGVDVAHIGLGQMLRLERRADSYAAEFISAVGIFHCIGARTTGGEEELRAAYQQGNATAVRSLRRDRHEQQSTCWLHRPSFCLSRTEGLSTPT